jgi:hypothetical protein
LPLIDPTSKKVLSPFGESERLIPLDNNKSFCICFNRNAPVKAPHGDLCPMKMALFRLLFYYLFEKLLYDKPTKLKTTMWPSVQKSIASIGVL